MRCGRKIGVAAVTLCSLIFAQSCSNESQLSSGKLNRQSQEKTKNTVSSLNNIRDSIEEIIDDDRQNSLLVVGTYREYLAGNKITKQIQLDASQSSGTTVQKIPEDFAFQINELPKDRNIILVGSPYSNHLVDRFKADLSPGYLYIPNPGTGRILGVRLKNGKAGILVTGYNELDTERAANALSMYDKVVNNQNYDFNFSIIDVIGSKADDGNLVIVK